VREQIPVAAEINMQMNTDKSNRFVFFGFLQEGGECRTAIGGKGCFHSTPFPMQRASRVLLANMCGLKGNERTLSLWGSELDGGHYHFLDRERNRACFSFYSMPPEGFEELLEFVVRWRPEFVFGYVSVLYMVAEALEKRGYTSLGTKVILTHAEKLYGFQRAKIQRVFGGEVFEHYSSREISDYGVECRKHNGIHLFSDLRLFELEPLGDEDRIRVHTVRYLYPDGER
jgi:hypothetical protein